MPTTRDFIAIAPDGERHEGDNVRAFCLEHDLTPTAVYQLLAGKGRSHKGWKFYREGAAPPSDSVASPELLSSIATLDLSKYGCPPMYVGKAFNPDHARWKYAVVSNLMMAVALGQKEQPKGFNISQVQALLADECRAHGQDPKHLADTRSDAEKMLDAIGRFEKAPESLLELASDEIDAIERAMLDALKHTREYLEDMAENKDVDLRYQAKGSGGGGGDGPKVRRARLERWLALIRKVKKIRIWAREDVPPRKGWPDPEGMLTDRAEEQIWSASHLLRFTAYMGRSTMSVGKAGNPSDYVYRWVRCHAKASTDIWRAENGVILTKREGYIPNQREYWGAMVIMPPGHGKTTLGDHWVVRRIGRNMREMGAVLHAKEEKAKDSLKYVAQCINGDNASGRRFRSLYPEVVSAGYDNNAGTIRLKTRDAAKSPTLQAFGCKSAGLGHDTTFQKWDDVVPQSDAEQSTERDRRHKLLTNTFGSRQRGKHTFTLVMGYFWHHDDALSRLYQDAKLAVKNQGGVRMVVSIQKCGGPKSSPAFKPLWPDVYSAAFLRQRYRQMRDPHAYAANYMGDPRAQEARIIQRVALYDRTSTAHAEFMRNAEIHVSLDPAGTNRQHSDKAGIVRCAVGEVERPGSSEGDKEYHQRIRVVGAQQIHANQHELVNQVAIQSLDRRIDYIHVEVTSGFYATADGFREMGIENVVEHTPGQRNKEVRLRNIATMIENSHASTGIEAVVEFPGVPIIRDDGSYVMEVDENGRQLGRKLKPDPEFEELFTQVLDFGVCESDHLIDPLVHVCKHLSRDIGIMEGAISRVVRRELDSPRNRLQEHLDRFKNKYGDDGKTAWQEDAEFCPVAM